MNNLKINEKLSSLIERINSLPDEKFPDYERGLYFLFSNGNLVYIGMSEIGVRRVVQHKSKEFDSFKFLELQDYTRAELIELETALIAIFNPPYNTQALPKGLQLLINAINKL